MRKQAFGICENKDADQICGNRLLHLSFAAIHYATSCFIRTRLYNKNKQRVTLVDHF